MSLRCMIVDDEPLARRVLEKYIHSLPSLELVKQCGDAIEASAWLHANAVDLIFLDIKMPELSGLDFLKTLDHPPKIILTTAYSEYALEGYEYAVADYLLKPIAFERFLKAVNRIIPTKQAAPVQPQAQPNEPFIFIRVDNADEKVEFDQIRYVQGYGNFVKIFMQNRMLLTASTLAHMETLLPVTRFARVHKSYIVSIPKIDKLEGNMIRLAGETIPIGKHYKMRLEEMLQKYRI